MKKKLFMMLFLSSINIIAGTIKNLNKENDSVVKDEKFINKIFSGKARADYNTPLGSIAPKMSSAYHGQNSTKSQKHDFGSSKYDKDILWGSDIDENDIQGSLNRYRKKRQEEELQPYCNAAIGIVIIFLVFSVYYYNKNN